MKKVIFVITSLLFLLSVKTIQAECVVGEQVGANLQCPYGYQSTCAMTTGQTVCCDSSASCTAARQQTQAYCVSGNMVGANLECPYGYGVQCRARSGAETKCCDSAASCSLLQSGSYETQVINFDEFNPLVQGNPSGSTNLRTPAAIISRALQFILPLAGMILFVMIVWGGFEIISQAATKKSIEQGKQRITAALVGFILIFVSYWIAQILGVVLGIKIL